MTSTGNESRGDILDIVEPWLQQSRSEDVLQNAVIRNQAPYLVQHLYRRRLEEDGVLAPNAKRETNRLRRFVSTFESLAISVKVRTRRPVPVRADADKAELLFVSFQANSTRAQLPVAVELVAKGAKTHFLVDPADRDSRALLSAAALSHSLHPPLFAPSTLHLALPTFLRASRALLDRKKLMTLVESVGLSPTIHETSSLQEGLRRELALTSVRGAAIYTAIRQIGDPRGVLFSTHRALLDEILPRALPQSLRFMMLQGITPTAPRISTRLHVNAAFAGSEIDRPYLEACGVPAAQTFILGYPDYDRFAHLDRKSCRAKITQRYPQMGTRKLAVFFSQYPTALFPESARRINLEIVRDCAHQLPDTFFIVKLHPRRENWSPGQLPPNLVVEKATDSFELIAGADVVVTFWSTTALETMLLGTPLVQLNGTGLPDLFDISRRIPRPTARTARQLAQLMQEATSEKGFAAQAAARQGLHALQDGRAAVRVSDLLVEKLATRM